MTTVLCLRHATIESRVRAVSSRDVVRPLPNFFYACPSINARATCLPAPTPVANVPLPSTA